MTPNKKAPERVWMGIDVDGEPVAVGIEECRGKIPYVPADLYDALKAKVLALNCTGACWGKRGIDMRCDVCKLKEEVNK